MQLLEIALIPVHPIPNKLSSKSNLHTTNETRKVENKGTRGLKEWNGEGGRGGREAPHLPARLVTGYGATTRREVMDLSVSRLLYFPLFLPLKKHLAGKRDADVGQAVSS